MGREEIVVYLPALQLDAGIQFAERLIQEIPAKTKPGVTVSGGMSSWTTAKIRGKAAFHSSIIPIIFLNWGCPFFPIITCKVK